MTPSAPDRLFLDFQAAVAGRYSLERELGRGGMGVVYLARDLRLDRVVAVKLLPPERGADTRERFLREARTAARLSHPHIIPIHAVEETDGFVFFVMAFIDGETLGARVRRDGPLKAYDAARILREVAWALAYAHGQGVVHRDVKPDNILIERGSGRALVADFGIARLVQAPLPGLSGEGELVGTPEYMSPEQASGSAVDGRSDLYSLGVVGYYALSGRLPFTAQSVAAVLAQHVTKASPPLDAPGAPRALVEAVEACLAKDPARRPQSGEDLASTLGTAVEARRDLPVPVRAFLSEGRGPALTRYLGPFFGAAIIIPAGLTMVLDVVFAGNPPVAFTWGVLGVAGILLGIGASSPIVLGLLSLRRLRQAGYRHDDLLRGLEHEVERRREEQAFAGGQNPSRWERLMRSKMYASLGLTALAGAAAFFVPYPAVLAAFGVFILSGAAAVATGIAAVAASRNRLEGPDERRLRFWDGLVGRWLFKLAGIGLKRSPGLPVTDRPTEVALGLAALDLFEALPGKTREQLGDLRSVVRGLEERVRRLRANGQEARLGEALGALEMIRFDLLRLQGGVGTVEGLTADLGAAREIGAKVDALLEGKREVDDALR